MLGKPSYLRRKHLEKHGVRSKALVLEISDKGPTVTTGNQAVASSTEVILRTKLRVEPESETSFEVVKHFRYAQFSAPPVGLRLGVIYDPDNHDHIMLEHATPASSPFSSGGIGLGNGRTLGGMLSAVQSLQQVQAESHGDPHALSEAVGATLGGGTMLINGRAMTQDRDGERDPVEQLTELAGLRDRGVLSDSEFEAQKARILSG